MGGTSLIFSTSHKFTDQPLHWPSVDDLISRRPASLGCGNAIVEKVKMIAVMGIGVNGNLRTKV
jgi:hypothetical protein